MEDVCAFLEENGLDEYVASFKANKINGKLLRALKRDRLLKMVRHVYVYVCLCVCVCACVCVCLCVSMSSAKHEISHPFYAGHVRSSSGHFA